MFFAANPVAIPHTMSTAKHRFHLQHCSGRLRFRATVSALPSSAPRSAVLPMPPPAAPTTRPDGRQTLSLPRQHAGGVRLQRPGNALRQRRCQADANQTLRGEGRFVNKRSLRRGLLFFDQKARSIARRPLSRWMTLRARAVDRRQSACRWPGFGLLEQALCRSEADLSAPPARAVLRAVAHPDCPH